MCSSHCRRRRRGGGLARLQRGGSGVLVPAGTEEKDPIAASKNPAAAAAAAALVAAAEAAAAAGVRPVSSAAVERPPGPSWKELYVGQRVVLASAAVARLETYGIEDSVGAAALGRRRGASAASCAAQCAGVVVEAVPPLRLQTHVSYAPATKVCVRAHASLCARARVFSARANTHTPAPPRMCVYACTVCVLSLSLSLSVMGSALCV